MNSNCPDCNQPLRNPKKCACGWTLTQSKQETHEHSANCAAYGCPMPAGINSGVTGGGMWVCHMHFRAHSSNWQTVTSRIRNHSTLVNLILEIRMAQNGRPFDYRDWMIRLKSSFPEYMPNDNDRRNDRSFSMRKWLDRLEKMLFSEVMPGMEEETASHGQMRSSEEIMKQIEEFLQGHLIEETA